MATRFNSGRKYTATTLIMFTYDQATVIESSTPDSPCLDLLFTNWGTETAYINGQPLRQYDSLRWSCNEGEILDVKCNLTFGTGGGTNKIYMTRRIIIN